MSRGLLPAWARWTGLGIAALLALPLAGLLSRVPWGEFVGLVGSPAALAALGLSLRTSFAATALSVLLGVPVALVLARGGIPEPVLKAVRTLVLLPLVLPPVVGGIALLATYGRRGLVGQLVLPLGIEIGFTTLAVVIAQTFVAMPFLVLTLEGALRARSTELEAVALTLGASPTRVLATVTLPLLAPSLVTGTVLVFARALGEFGATLTFAGSLAGVTRTLPLEIYLQREVDQRAAIAMSVLLVVVAAVIVAVAYRAPGGPGRSRRGGDAGLRAGAASPTDAVVRAGAGAAAPTGAGVPAGADAHAARAGAAPVGERPGAGGAFDAPALDARIRIAGREVDVHLRAGPGETVAIIGPNGAGKSTVVDAIAGLLPLDDGAILLGGTVLDDPARRLRVPPHRRGVARLGQDPLLLPHLDLAANVGYGLRVRGASRRAARAAAAAWLARTEVGGLDERRPHEVSGGQAQRAAIARALAVDPRLWLWDEPFAALDIAVAPRQRELVAAHSAGRTSLLVTHDLADVRALADRVVVLEEGRVVQDAPLAEFLRDPAPGFAAAFVAGAPTPDR
ncbi:MAG: molybdate ABC transporter permease subunit [Microbacteriaceae bacterium]|nr:molybdate ABC transporter permease subunit [Microbacteriaceae bacterium]